MNITIFAPIIGLFSGYIASKIIRKIMKKYDDNNCFDRNACHNQNIKNIFITCKCIPKHIIFLQNASSAPVCMSIKYCRKKLMNDIMLMGFISGFGIMLFGSLLAQNKYHFLLAFVISEFFGSILFPISPFDQKANCQMLFSALISGLIGLTTYSIIQLLSL